MKKQLFSLVMMLALVVLAGTSAKAQDGLTAGTPVWHMRGSTHGVSVENAHTGTSYTWLITASTCAGAANGAAVGASITTGSADATITYTNAATGIYRITCTEAADGCSTVREFYTAIMNIDVVVTSTEDDGLTAAAVSSCNDYNLLMSSDLVGNTNADDNSNNLNGWQDGAHTPLLHNTRWVNVTLSVAELSGCATPPAGAPVATGFAWKFDYTIAGTNFISPDNFITMDPVTGVTYGNAADETNTITVAANTTSITIPLRSYIRWGLTDTDQDQQFTFTVDSGTTVLDDDATLDWTDGTEPAANNGNNQSTNQLINASPATPRITIND